MSVAAADPVAEVLARLKEVKRLDAGGYLARCPAHDDQRQSLSVGRGEDGRALLKCHAGCETDSVVLAAGLELRDLFPPIHQNGNAKRDVISAYPYRDENGTLLFEVVRFFPKGFAQRRANGDWGVRGVRRVLYRLREVVRAVAAGELVFVVEGERDADRLAAAGLAATTNAGGAGKFTADLCPPLTGARVVILPDNDPSGRSHAEDVAAKLAGIAAEVRIVELPGLPPKGDVSDWLDAGHAIEELKELATAERKAAVDALQRARARFREWLGDGYDIEALEAVLCTLAAERLGGDPLWLLLVSGSGNAKTETVQAARGAGARVVSTITSEGALLSASPKKQQTKDATGGLLRAIGERGVLVVKDFTSILSMSREMRGQVLAALREIHDGRWTRNVGTDGGRTLEWEGRLAVIGAVTTAWDEAHSVIAACGDRFVLLRMDSTHERHAAGRRAIRNTGSEEAMRAELSAAVAEVVAAVDTAGAYELTEHEVETILAAADLVTTARTSVIYDYRGDVVDAHAPEMPTRFAKQLTQLVRGGLAIGMDRSQALRLAIRAARDSMPPLRLAILLDVHAHPDTPTKDVRRRLEKPRATVDRQLQSLHILGLLRCAEQEEHRGTVWRYTVSDRFDPAVLSPPNLVPDLSVDVNRVNREERESEREAPFDSTDVSGTTREWEKYHAEAQRKGLA